MPTAVRGTAAKRNDGVLAPSSTAYSGLAALAAGAIFGFGLALAQMINPLKVLAFLDVSGPWDASLMFVMGGAVLLAAAGFHLVLRRPRPLFDLRFRLPVETPVDRRLVVGAAIFGVGWGLGGYCPGPAIATLGLGNPEAWWFVPAMLAGAGLQRWQARRTRYLAPVAAASRTPGT
jgi:uncharacterized membrane protein YedE/YeeE